MKGVERIPAKRIGKRAGGEAMEGIVKFFKGRRVLVTGHTGFKGSWLSLWLSGMGARVTGFSLPPPTVPSMFDVLGLEGIIDHVEGDVRDGKALEKIVSRVKPSVVFHLAAQPLVRLSVKEPVLTYETNVMGTVNVLEAVRNAGCVDSCVCITSDKCYENREWEFAYRENDPMGGHDPYSSSKGAAEIAIASYRRTYFSGPGTAAIASARAGNVIGGGDWALDRIIPDCVRAIQKAGEGKGKVKDGGARVVLRNPDAVRPWQHVLEPLWGYLLLASACAANRESCATAFNFGPFSTSCITVEQVVEKFIKAAGRSRTMISLPSDADRAARSREEKIHEARFLRLDSSRAFSMLGWQPRLSVDEALQITADWYSAWLEASQGSNQGKGKGRAAGKRMLDLTRAQIKRYEQLMDERTVEDHR